MRIERPSQACLPLAITAMVLLPGCGRKQAPPPVAPRIDELAYQPDPWAWHKVGGVLVVTGELLSPMELTLTGRHMNARIHAESGPIRWEFHAPPPGEVVTLRTSDGKLLAKWNLDVPMPEPQVAQAPPKAPAPPAAAVAAKRMEAPWPETHLPLPKGLPAPSPPVQTWNPCLPVAPQVAVKPAEEPWPETHLPLMKGRFPKALPPVPPLVAAKSAGPPWPETHLPLSKGLPVLAQQAAAPAPVQTWNPCLPNSPKLAPELAAKTAEAPWPETHLPLPKGRFPKTLLPKPVPPQVAATSAVPPWPDTHLPQAKGLFRIAMSSPALAPVEGGPGADPLPTRTFIAKVMNGVWPETHLPQMVGRAPSTPAAPLPAMALSPRRIPQAAPRVVAGLPWPETHLPRSQGLFRLAVSKPVPVSFEGVPGAALPTLPLRPIVLKAANDAWPDTHLPRMHGEPQKVASKPLSASEPNAPAEPSVLPVPAQEPATLPALPSPSTPEWPGQGEAFNLVRGPRGSHWVCMTFDGGSSDEVALDVLNALKERGILTTFFLTGDFIGKFPEIVRRIVRDGHEVGNHTMDHPHLAPGGKRDPRWTKERFQQQLLQADAAFLRLAGRPMDPYWRAPYGEQTTELRKWAEELGYRHIAWSEGADTLDWATVKERKLYRTGNAILDRLRDRMERQDGDGLIVLMHLGSARPEGDRPARVLGPFLDQALDGGWNFVNIGAYLKEAGKARWDATSRLAVLTQRSAHP